MQFFALLTYILGLAQYLDASNDPCDGGGMPLGFTNNVGYLLILSLVSVVLLYTCRKKWNNLTKFVLMPFGLIALIITFLGTTIVFSGSDFEYCNGVPVAKIVEYVPAIYSYGWIILISGLIGFLPPLLMYNTILKRRREAA